ncbi:ribosome biogenesis protein Nop53/GLTSCR2 [Polychytrium aggregatum]|uniref:ribosome biogenesis protein Nop53/GLTSCR2 n=1 Tax=Polychytrium aggregatum TaxID=110093 RepID=UPI0022FE4B35|nr:ribosome biogenesis protein Nop53/GLTSCR2 [Polychytrium aggregatum]KAI9199481.1 ribosome biogenesis protein Nop53/GLTSCR2 [Polychytrium aggregatum]
MSDQAATKKKMSQPSRKGKKAWRKNVDIKDVEEQLEELRSEERISGQHIHTKPDADLFVIDTSGDSKEKSAQKFKKTLKVDEILRPQSAVASPTAARSQKGVVKTVNAKGKTTVASKAAVDQINKIVKRRQEHGVPPKPAPKKKGTTYFDMWDAPEEPSTLNDYVQDHLPQPAKKPDLPSTKATNVSAVKVAHAGASYNPKFDEHQTLLQSALNVELDKIAKSEKISKQLEYPKELDDLDEDMFVDYDDDDEDPNAEGGEDGDDEDAPDAVNHTKSVANVRKSKAQRNKERRRLQLERAEKEERERKQLLKHIGMVESISAELDSQEQETKEKLGKRAEIKEKLKQSGASQIGPHKFKSAPLEIQLTEELSDSLRSLKPEGNMFKDRFLSLQERKLIEPRVPVTLKRKLKHKEVERHDYKRFK